jgi:hypothetical protein
MPLVSPNTPPIIGVNSTATVSPKLQLYPSQSDAEAVQAGYESGAARLPWA